MLTIFSEAQNRRSGILKRLAHLSARVNESRSSSALGLAVFWNPSVIVSVIVRTTHGRIAKLSYFFGKPQSKIRSEPGFPDVVLTSY
jgi:hypothetical protein